MVKDLNLTKTNLTKLIDGSSSWKSKHKKADVINSIMQHIENHDLGVYEYGPDISDSTIANKWWWTLNVDENNATIYRSPLDDMNSEFIEYKLRQYNEHYLTNNENKINNNLADAIMEGETTWATDIDNALISSKNGKVFLSVEKDDKLDTIEIKDGKMYTKESFKYLLPEEVGELFSFLRFNSSNFKDAYQYGITLNYLHEDYLNQPFDDVSLLFDQISKESLEIRTMVFDNITKGMTNGQVYQILEGVRDGLDISIYADSSYDYKQMHNIRIGLLKELPYTIYTDSSIEADKMTVIREALESGAPADIIASFIERNDYAIMSIADLEGAMDDVLDYNSEDLSYHIYINAGTDNEVRFMTYRYEDAINKWSQLDGSDKSLAIYNVDIHDEEDNPLVILDMLNGKERLLISQAYKDVPGMEKRSDSPSSSLLEALESNLIEDIKIDSSPLQGGSVDKDTGRVKKTPLQEITASLEEGVKDVFGSDKYQSYLDTMSRFHGYSLNNQLLIFLQNPDATYVKGYGDGKNAKGGWFDLGRQVKGGEKAIKILAPAFVSEKYKGELYKTAIKELENYKAYHIPHTKLSIIKNNDKTYSIASNGVVSNERYTNIQLSEYLKSKVIGKKLCGFRPVNVFDVSQCVIRKVKDKDGNIINDPRADNAVLSLSGEVVNRSPEKMKTLFDVLVSVSDKNQVPIEVKSINRGYGYYDIDNKMIAVSDDINESHKVKTAIHEIAHSRLHNEVTDINIKSTRKSLRATWEVQAESIAYVVSKELGLDTSDYSFGYIAGWSSGRDLEELKNSMDIISKESKKLISDIDNELRVRNINRSDLSMNKKLETREFSEVYKEDPFLAFSSLRDDSEYKDFRGLTDNDLHFMANSKFIKERYSTFLKYSPDKFINKSLEQLHQVKDVDGYEKNPFVEISFCENVLDKAVFNDGQILDIKEADRGYRETETIIQAERTKAKDADFPYMKCYASIYAPVEYNNKNTLAVIHTKTSIGDGLQKGLVDALKNSDKLNKLDPGIKGQILSMLSSEVYDKQNHINKGIGGVKQKVDEYKKASIKEMNIVNMKQKEGR